MHVTSFLLFVQWTLVVEKLWLFKNLNFKHKELIQEGPVYLLEWAPLSHTAN